MSEIKLSARDLELLKQGKEVGPWVISEQAVYISVDDFELNKNDE